MSIDECREGFEKSAKQRCEIYNGDIALILNKNKNGQYESELVHCAWQGFQDCWNGYVDNAKTQQPDEQQLEQRPCPAECDNGVDWSSGAAETCKECDGSGTFYIRRQKDTPPTISLICKELHYPACWDTTAYPTVFHAILATYMGCLCFMRAILKEERKSITYIAGLYTPDSNDEEIND